MKLSHHLRGNILISQDILSWCNLGTYANNKVSSFGKYLLKEKKKKKRKNFQGILEVKLVLQHRKKLLSNICIFTGICIF